LFGCQSGAFLRHDFVGIGAGHQRDEITLPALSGDGRGTGISPLQKGLPRINAQATLGSTAPVAANATGLEDGLNFRFEIDPVAGRGRQGFDLVSRQGTPDGR
jgi:hypothetical protein